MEFNAEKRTVVFYDGACPLCRAEIDVYARRDGDQALCFIDVAAPETVLPPGLSRDQALARFHVVAAADGTLLSGAAAFAELWRRVPGWRWLGHLAARPLVLRGLEIVYRAFLRVRPLIVRGFVFVSRRASTG
jgi:predicted DCC family thiol-disulfide oxidoreductase YuxK